MTDIIDIAHNGLFTCSAQASMNTVTCHTPASMYTFLAMPALCARLKLHGLKATQLKTALCPEVKNNLNPQSLSRLISIRLNFSG